MKGIQLWKPLLILTFFSFVPYLIFRKRAWLTRYGVELANPSDTSYFVKGSSTDSIDFGVDIPPNLREQAIEKLALASKESNKKTIVIWYPPWGYRDGHVEDSRICGNCEVTYDRNKISDASTGAVVFHFLEISQNTMPPLLKRNYSQLYIYWTMEGTPYMRYTAKKDLNFEDQYKFNATMSYRRDSDFFTSYGQVHKTMSLFSGISPDDILQYKSKLAIAVVSNCALIPGAEKRGKLIGDIQSHGFKVDTFGRCYPNELPRDGTFLENLKKYKFFFSFENSYHCKDYITEKFFRNAMKSFSLPVVWGARKEDYEAVSPPHSFIHIDDFNSTKELVEYLEYLDKNTTAYLEYFRWHRLKPNDIPEFGRTMGYCQICRVLHGINVDDVFNPQFDSAHQVRPLLSDGLYRRTVPSVKEFFYTSENKECFENEKYEFN